MITTLTHDRTAAILTAIRSPDLLAWLRQEYRWLTVVPTSKDIDVRAHEVNLRAALSDLLIAVEGKTP
jgi:hypothetical protein